MQGGASAGLPLGGCTSIPLPFPLAASSSPLFLLQGRGWGSLGDPTCSRTGFGAVTSRQEGPTVWDSVQNCHRRNSLTSPLPISTCAAQRQWTEVFFQLQKHRKPSNLMNADPERNQVLCRRSYRGAGEALVQGNGCASPSQFALDRLFPTSSHVQGVFLPAFLLHCLPPAAAPARDRLLLIPAALRTPARSRAQCHRLLLPAPPEPVPVNVCLWDIEIVQFTKRGVKIIREAPPTLHSNKTGTE